MQHQQFTTALQPHHAALLAGEITPQDAIIITWRGELAYYRRLSRSGPPMARRSAREMAAMYYLKLRSARKWRTQ